MSKKFTVRRALLALSVLAALGLTACKNQNGTEGPMGSSVERTTAPAKEPMDGTADLPIGETEDPTVNGTAQDNETNAEQIAPETEVPETAVPLFHDASSVLDHYPRVFVVTEREFVYVRTAPQSAGKIIGVIPQYGGGTILQNSVDAKWVEVQSGTLRGYVSAGYITTGDAGKEIAQKYARERVRVTADAAYIMMTADESGTKLDTVFSGNVYDYLGEEGDFYEVLLPNGVNGYILKRSCEQGLFLMEARAQEMNGVTVVLNAFGCEEDAATAMTGTVSGEPAYKINLTVAARVKKELESRGYTVFMVRKGGSCSLDGKGRAEASNDYGANVMISIKCARSDNVTTEGISTYSVSEDNEHQSKAQIDAGGVLSYVVSERVENATGTKCIGRNRSDSFDELNFSEATAVILEIGYLSNESEDRKLNDEMYQGQIANGVANGLDTYFGFKR